MLQRKMVKGNPKLFSIIGLCIFVHGSSQNEELEYEYDDSGEDYSRRDAAKVATEFERKIWNVAADLYKGVNQKEDGSFVLSPLSLTTLMIMLNAGAEGEMAREIRHVFKLGNDSQLALQNHTQVLKCLKNQTADKDSGVELVTTSRIFANSKNANILSSYKTAVSLLGEIESFPFTDPKQVVEKTNEWVKNRTRGKISKLVEEKDFTDETAAVLLDAVYFKAPWKIQFNKSKTKQDDFHVNWSKKVQVDMMHISAEFPYADIAEVEASAVFLPYKGDRMSMIIYLPWPGRNLFTLEQKLKNLVPSEIRNRATTTEISLHFPKFNISSSLDLKPILTSLGVQKLFNGTAANFSKLSSSPAFHVSKIRQQVIIEVNEVGTEAATATGAIGLVPISVTTVLNVNRPFIFQIFDETTRTVLFTGRITNPNGNKRADFEDSFEFLDGDEDAWAAEMATKKPFKVGGGGTTNHKPGFREHFKSFVRAIKTTFFG